MASRDSLTMMITRDSPSRTATTVWARRECARSRCRLRKAKNSSDSDCGPPNYTLSPRASEFREPGESTRANSSQEESCRCGPRRPLHLRRGRAYRRPASSALLVRDRSAGSVLKQSDHANPEFRLVLACQNGATVQRWHGTGCKIHRRGQLAQA